MDDSFVIAIPSYKRFHLINNLTLESLRKHNINKKFIHIFVVENEFNDYRNAVPTEYNNIVIGLPGLVQQREFIESYFPLNTKIIYLDDDIKEIDLSLTSFPSLESFFVNAFLDCEKHKASLWSVYPVYNKFFMEKQSDLTTDLNYMVGAFYGIVNRRLDHLRLEISREFGNKEDVERSIKYFMNDGIVLRYNRIGFETKYYRTDGSGLGTLKDRFADIIVTTNALASKYKSYGKIKVRKSGIHEFKLNKIKSFDINELNIKVLENINPNEFNLLLKQLKSAYFKFRYGKDSRKNFPPHYNMTFGMVNDRIKHIVNSSYHTRKYPDIFEEINRIGKLICPFPYTSIHINKNLTSPHHKDNKNIGKSLLVSFGDYTGSKIVIEGKDYDANCCPIVFNGSLLEHWNTDDLVGTKYSLVFYNISI